MKTLIVYYSHGGNNELLAYRLQKELDCDITEVEPTGKRTGFSIFLDIAFLRTPRVKPCTVPLDRYDLIIFVAPIWAGKVAAPLKSFLLRERERIGHYAFISLCGGGMKEQATRVRKQLTSIVGYEPVALKELWVVDLPMPDLKASPNLLSGYRVTPEDVNHFVPDIQMFVDELTPEIVQF
jgi:flavodoxin